MNYAEHGYIRIAALAPAVSIADPNANAAAIIESRQQAPEASLLLYPELCISGYTCEDLFFSHDLLERCELALAQVAHASGEQIIVVGCPWRLADGRLLNAAMVCHAGRVVGAVPKIAHPNYGEFYDKRWFVSGRDIDEWIRHPQLGEFRMSTQQLFSIGASRFAIEICEDLWLPIAPSSSHVLAGAELIVNLSASNELVAKADYRRDLVRMASAQNVCAYLYASAGPTESTKDIVFGGHLLFAENGSLIAESDRFSFAGSQLQVEFDWQKLRHDRSANSTFSCSPRPAGYHSVQLSSSRPVDHLLRHYPAQPFVPDDETEFAARAIEIMQIQSIGLARRMIASHSKRLVLGLSGGLDSTLAMLVCMDALAALDKPPETLVLITMPGPATSQHTLQTAQMLAAAAGTRLLEIRIDASVAQHLSDLGHGGEHDVVFENAQARERTQLLFDYANQCAGIVVGTGDLSELALGWCTYNADHMSSYGVNASVPKTLVQYLIRWYARHRAAADMQLALQRVLDTPISPELVPSSDDDEPAQHTESIIGPYQLHDFFIYHYLRNGFAIAKIFALARLSHGEHYSDLEIRKWLRVFIQRFHTQQFKRTTLPAGPKVGTVSLSPRGDWRMPDEVSVNGLLALVDALPVEDPASGTEH